mgnify:FL=1
MQIIIYGAIFLTGMLAGFLLNLSIINIKEEKTASDVMAKAFEKETMNRKASVENNIGLQLDVNRIRKTKDKDLILRRANELEMLQNINKYKEILREK